MTLEEIRLSWASETVSSIVFNKLRACVSAGVVEVVGEQIK